MLLAFTIYYLFRSDRNNSFAKEIHLKQATNLYSLLQILIFIFYKWTLAWQSPECLWWKSRSIFNLKNLRICVQMIEWKSDRDESCWKYIVWYFMPAVIAQAQFTYRASDKSSHLLPISELFSFGFFLCCCITLALSCIWLQTSKSFTERIASLKNVIFLLRYIANRLVSFIFKKNKLFLSLLKITDGFLTREEWGRAFLPFILYLEMAVAYLQIALFNLTEAKGHARSKCEIRSFPERKYLLPEVCSTDSQWTGF